MSDFRALVEGVAVDTRHWIAGRRVASAATFESVSPIDETVLETVSAGGAHEVDLAVLAATALLAAAVWLPVAQDLLGTRSVPLTTAAVALLAGLVPGVLLRISRRHQEH